MVLPMLGLQWLPFESAHAGAVLVAAESISAHPHYNFP
jgi:hypothetical protein